MIQTLVILETRKQMEKPPYPLVNQGHTSILQGANTHILQGCRWEDVPLQQMMISHPRVLLTLPLRYKMDTKWN